MLSSAAVRDHLPYPADMSGAWTAKHHDNVLCYSGFFVAQCSFSHPLHLQSTESTTPTLQLLQFRSREIDSSSWLPSEAAKYGADPTDQATSSDIKRRQATSSDVKRRQATSSDATGQIRQIRQVRHHSGGLFVVRLWTRRLQRCVEVLDAMQVPAWLRNPFCAAVCLCPFLLLT